MTKTRNPSYLFFDKAKYLWKPNIDYRAHPELYRVGKGEQGVLICQPYKSELTRYWRFKTPAIAEQSSTIIFRMFKKYLTAGDFVGADMARKFLQMGYTRSRRYANYRGGTKYDRANDYTLNERGTGDDSKARSAAIFYAKWKEAEANAVYSDRKKAWKAELG